MATGLQAQGRETGALLRHEGSYSSHLTRWRRQVAALDAQTSDPRRGRKPDPARPEKLKIDQLERDLIRSCEFQR